MSICMPIKQLMASNQKLFDSNQMGQALWRGPSWWMEGSATLVSSLYCYQHPELFDKIDDWWDWESLMPRFEPSAEKLQTIWKKNNRWSNA